MKSRRQHRQEENGPLAKLELNPSSAFESTLTSFEPHFPCVNGNNDASLGVLCDGYRSDPRMMAVV